MSAAWIPLVVVCVTLALLAAVTAIILGIEFLRGQWRDDEMVFHYQERRRNGASSSGSTS